MICWPADRSTILLGSNKDASKPGQLRVFGSAEIQCHSPGQRLAVLGREALESGSGRLTTWNDGDVVRSGTLTPAKLERLALDDRGRGRDSERRSDGSEGSSGEDGVSCRDHLLRVLVGVGWV